LTSEGIRSFYFYTSDTTLIENSISESLVEFTRYHYDFEIKQDDEWECYFGFVYPEFNELERILDRQINVLEHCDDNLTKGREVNHWIYFKSIGDRKKFIER